MPDTLSFLGISLAITIAYKSIRHLILIPSYNYDEDVGKKSRIMHLNPEQIFHPATLISAATLGIYVALLVILSRQSRTREHFAFLYYLVTMIIWSFGSFMTRSLLIGSPLLWNEVQVVGIFGLPLAFYNFGNAYIGRRKNTETSLFVLGFLLIVALSLSGQIISSVNVAGGKQSIEIGNGAIIGAVWWLSLIIYSTFLIVRAYRRSTDDLEQRRLQYLLINLSIIIAGIFTNFTEFTVYPVDIGANTFAAFVLAYAIYRHQFLDFKFAIRSSLIYLIPTTVIASGYFLVISLTTRIVGNKDDLGFFVVSLLTAIAAALVTQPLRERAQFWVDKAFYRNTYDPTLLLETISSATSTIIDLLPLSQLIVDEIAEKMQYEQVTIFVKNQDLKQFNVIASSSNLAGLKEFTLDQRHPIPRYLSKVKAILSRDDLDLIPQLSGVSALDIENLIAYKFKYIIPLKSDEHLIGLLVLSAKRSGVPLNQRDTQTILAVANQISVAIDRAQNFETAQDSLTREQLLHEATKTIAQDIELDIVLDKLVENASRAINAYGGLVLFFDQELHRFTIENNHNLPRSLVELFLADKIHLAERALGQSASVIDSDDENAYLIIPLRSSKETYGIVVLFRLYNSSTFKEKEQLLAESIARQAGVAIQKARLFEETKTALIKERKLNELAQLLNKGFNLKQLLERLATQSAHVLQANTAILAINHQEEPRKNSVTYYNLPVDLETDIHGSFEKYWLDMTRLPSPVISQHPDHPHTPEELVTCGVTSLISIPFRVDVHKRGSLSLVRFNGQNRFSSRDIEVANAIANQASSSILNAMLFSELEDAYLQTVTALANAIDARDEYTNGHSERIALLAEHTAYELGFSEEELLNIHWAAKLHDIGKIGIPDHILNKPGPLTEEEWTIMRRHPLVGAEIIAPVKKLDLAAIMVRGHHEKWNGQGYPDGLAKSAIPLGARILAVVDAFVAMTDDRVYRQGRSFYDAISEIETCAGSQFDPTVADVFINKVLHKPEILQQFSDEIKVPVG